MSHRVKMIYISIGLLILVFYSCNRSDENSFAISTKNIEASEKVIGLQFTAEERDSLLENLDSRLEDYQKIREQTILNDIPPVLYFNPIPVRYQINNKKSYFNLGSEQGIKLPDDINQLAFYSIRDLAHLIKTQQISSLELTRFFLQRLRKMNEKLQCVISFTDDLAIREAKFADKEIAKGKYRGLLHGIPYGAKDLLAVKGYKTTWGAIPFREQVLESEATVIKKLRDAGAVLIAKLTLGALAWGDVWYGGKTRNPWDPEQGSSGSSAGSASATAAGLVPFAIGTETWGSIVSPSTRCGTTGLRPTFGRVSRAGAMALSWSMDKIGPICRSVEDCAIVFNAIYGPDQADQAIVDASFRYSATEWKNLRVGYLKSEFDEDYANRKNDHKTLEIIKEQGVELIEISLPDLPVSSMSFILSVEAAAAFDDLTRSNRDDLMVRQIRNAWPNVFRAARFIPAVEYIQANRLRYQLIQEMQKTMSGVDVYIAPSFGGSNLLLTNLTGHPCVVLPNGFDEKGKPASISFIGRLFEEGELLAFAQRYQESTDFHLQHPPIFAVNN